MKRLFKFIKILVIKFYGVIFLTSLNFSNRISHITKCVLTMQELINKKI